MTGLPDSAVAYLPRGVRLHDDKVRGIRVLLAPERAVQLDAVGDAILSELDGQRDLGTVITRLATRYDAPRAQIAADLRDYLGGLIERRMIFVKDPA